MAKTNKHITPTEAAELGEENAEATDKSLVKPDASESQALGAVSDEELEAQLAYEGLKKQRQKKRRRRIIIAAIVVVLAIGGGVGFFLVSNSNGDMKDALDALYEMPVVVRKGEFTATVGASGKTEPISQSVVSPEVDGIIENLSVTAGQQVNAGDVLFTIKNDAYDQDVRKKQEALDAAQRADDTSYRKVDEAYAARDRAWDAANDADDWSTYDELALNSAIYDAEANAVNADAQVVSAEEDLQEAQEKANKRTVVAPVTGNVVAVNAQNGQALGGAAGGTSNANTSSAPLVQIADTSQMKVSVQVNEVDIEDIAVGQDAEVTFQALPDVKLESKVQSIASVATGSSSSSSTGSDASGSGGVVTYAVVLTIPNTEGKIKPGMTASIVMTTKRIADALIVPSSAVYGEDTGNAHVFKITDAENQQYESVPVEITDKSAVDYAVKGKLADGDKLLGQDMDMLQAALGTTAD